jgi:hypothetical protein
MKFKLDPPSSCNRYIKIGAKPDLLAAQKFGVRDTGKGLVTCKVCPGNLVIHCCP